MNHYHFRWVLECLQTIVAELILYPARDFLNRKQHLAFGSSVVHVTSTHDVNIRSCQRGVFLPPWLVGATRPRPRDGGVEKLHGGPTVEQHPTVWTIGQEKKSKSQKWLYEVIQRQDNQVGDDVGHVYDVHRHRMKKFPTS